MVRTVAASAAVVGAFANVSFDLALVPRFGYSLEEARAVTFHFMALGQLALTYPSRHTSAHPLPNPYLHAAVAGGVTRGGDAIRAGVSGGLPCRVHDPDLARCYRRNAEALGRSFPELGALRERFAGSTDMGNVSHVVASFHPYIGINGGDAVNHQHQFAAAAITADADLAVLDGAKGLAMTMVDVATDPTLRAYVKEFSRR